MRIILLLILTFFAHRSTGQLKSKVIKDNLRVPWELIYGPDGNIWFTQWHGEICRLSPATGQMDIIYQESVCAQCGEGSMMGMALDPQFPSQPYVYVAYIPFPSGGNYLPLRVVKYTYGNNTFLNSQILLDSINGGGQHVGCRLVIANNQLYVSVGDNMDMATPQDIQSTRGKILRINLDGTIPADNPVAGNPVWSWGHRNPQGLVYANGFLYSSEHGNQTNDEINIIKKGGNYGWPNVEGYCNTAAEIAFCNDSNVVEPNYAWTPTLAVCGIDYYNHPMFPFLQNSLLVTTLREHSLWRLYLNPSHDTIGLTYADTQIKDFGRLRDLCISPDGRIYISTSDYDIYGTKPPGGDKIIELYDAAVVAGMADITTSKELTIQPNPATDYAKLKVSSGQKNKSLYYAVTDEEGKIVLQGTFKTKEATIQVKYLAAGIYTVTATAENGTKFSGKLVKE